MRRIEVAAGVWVVDYEAGIGGEGYDPPKPRRQKPDDGVIQYQEPTLAGVNVHQHYHERVQLDSWKVVGQMAVTAANQEQVAQ